MNLCLYCHAPIEEHANWQMFFGWSSRPLLCEACGEKLVPITGEICRICGRPYAKNEQHFAQKNFCQDCARWENDPEWKNVLTKNRSLYVYNSFLKQLIARFKYRGDAELAKIFAAPLQNLAKQYPKNALIVPIPISQKRLYERGFNQAEILASFLGGAVNALQHIGSEDKQSKKSRKQRLDIFKKSSFVLCKNVNKQIENHDIIIVDDIYTTGATVRKAAKILIENGATSVASITIAR